MKSKRQKPSSKGLMNRRASYDYELDDSLIVGLELTGAEAKSLRQGRAVLQGSYVNVVNGQLFLIGSKIFGSTSVPISEQDQTRTRKLLAKKNEIEKLAISRQQGLSIIPTQLMTNGRYIKLKISVGKGKKRYDKRETIKKRDIERSLKKQSNY